MVESQKLKALGIRNRIVGEIGAARAACAAAAPDAAGAESRKQKVSEVKQQIVEEEEEAQRLMAELHALHQVSPPLPLPLPRRRPTLSFQVENEQKAMIERLQSSE